MFGQVFLGLFVALVCLGLIDKISVGSIMPKYNFEKMKAAVKKEEVLKSAIIRCIVYEDTVPNLANNDLVEKGYIDEDTKNHGFKENCAKDNCYEYNYDKDKGTIIIIAKFDKPEIAKQYANFYTRSFKGKTIGGKVSTTYTIPLGFLKKDIRDDFRTAVCNSGRNCSDKYHDIIYRNSKEVPNPKKYSFWIDTSRNPPVKMVSDDNSTWKRYQEGINNKNTKIKVGDINILLEVCNRHNIGETKYLINQDDTNNPFIEEYVCVKNRWILVNKGLYAMKQFKEHLHK